MPTTQKDIAREAGVSQTVVSDVLQGRPRGRVSPDTRSRILETARRLDYRANTFARALRTRQSHQVGYVVTQRDIHDSNVLHEPAIGSLAASLSASGYRLLLEAAPTDEAQVSRLRELFASGACDAGVVRNMDPEPEFWPRLHGLERPVVVIGQCPDPALSSIAHDAPGLLRAALKQLRTAGHTSIALLTGRTTGDYYRLMRHTWDAARPEFGFTRAEWAREVVGRKAGEVFTSALLARETAPTGIICLNERAALGATEAIMKAGLRIAEDIDLIIIGSALHAWLYEPGTWYAGTDLQTIGRLAAEEVGRLLEGEPPSGPIRVLPEMRQL